MNIELLFRFIHLFVCLGVVVACICRLNNEVCRKYKRARFRVVLIMAAVLLSLLQGLIFGTAPTKTETLVVAALLVSMVLNASRWMHSYLKHGEHHGS